MLENFINWIIGSSKFTDWVQIILNILLVIPVLFLLNDKLKIQDKISKMCRRIKRRIKDIRFKYFIENPTKKDILSYLKKSNNEFNLKNASFHKDKSINFLKLISKSDTEVSLHFSKNDIISYSKFNFSKLDKVPIELLDEILSEIKCKGKIQDFIKKNKLSKYFYKKYINDKVVPSLV